MTISFLIFLGCFFAIGIFSATQSRDTPEDYLLASRDVNPWLTGLSAVATSNSGFMFIGMIGTTYIVGVSAAWMVISWLSGEYLAWRYVYKTFREKTGQMQASTFPMFLGHQSGQRQHRGVVIAAALVTLAFLGTYSAAQLTAGSKALYVLFGWDYSVGTLLGAAIVTSYCFAGGIRASIWTDAAQAIVMLVSMMVLLVYALLEIGGFQSLWLGLKSIDRNLVDWQPRNLQFGIGFYVLGWFMAGLGVIGQPHVMVRAMAIDSSTRMGTARRVYFTWYVVFWSTALLVGLASRLIIPATDGLDTELALPQMSQILLPDILIGLLLAGLFAATISTADSQILSCSAALTQDLFPAWGRSYIGTKMGTLVIMSIVVLFVLFEQQTVYDLVLASWSILAAAFAPLVIVRVLGQPVSSGGAIAMITGGVIMTLYWRFGLELSGSVSGVLPGMLAGGATYLTSRLFKANRPL